jgi:hypothetical protein
MSNVELTILYATPLGSGGLFLASQLQTYDASGIKARKSNAGFVQIRGPWRGPMSIEE